jgi:hypothetical protein
MIVKLFDIQNGQVVPSEHCYTLGTLKRLMDKYPDDYLKVYQYLFYMTCPDPDINPFFHVPEADKEILIFNELDPDFSLEDDAILKAKAFCETLYETPTKRAYDGIRKALDRIANYMANTAITDGKDGNIGQIRAMAKDFESIRQSFKGAYKDLQDEQQSRIRGGGSMAYDQ